MWRSASSLAPWKPCSAGALPDALTPALSENHACRHDTVLEDLKNISSVEHDK